MSEKTARGNRWGLAIVGLVLLAGGLLSLARGLHLLPGAPAGKPVLDAWLRRAAEPAWFWPVAAACCVLVALLGLRWLAVQARTDRVRRLRLANGPTGRTVLDADALADAVADEIAGYRGVRRATAQLRQGRRGRSLHLVVVADDRGDVAAVRARVETEALPRARRALAIDTIPTSVLVHVATGADRRGRAGLTRVA